MQNSLFPRPVEQYGDSDLLEAQRLDHGELVQFISHLHGLVTRAVSLPPNVPSEQILSLKEDLDMAYETSSGLADDQSGNHSAIRELTVVIMKTVRSGADGDRLAESELEAEEQARAAHYALLEYPIVADLLRPDTLIGADELAATLLGETPEALAAALSLFDAVQLSELVSESRMLLNGRAGTETAQDRLAQMEDYLMEAGGSSVN
ncbi:MAG: hypothetical protein A2286_02195 [Gammaproteobacteria bacterium RIFOXYA12_FULL_61_12]|nr:MAG: hypothetical protein A2286_02195 [Gammaproteobacteria bacterium RIFOXYA12_FULL_61_12]OGT90634.1 MAG: hypothetical protein A2514_13200 [Gammaproteobacteria bacterium RIFOXYD12_FULL_61_37]